MHGGDISQAVHHPGMKKKPRGLFEEEMTLRAFAGCQNGSSD